MTFSDTDSSVCLSTLISSAASTLNSFYKLFSKRGTHVFQGKFADTNQGVFFVFFSFKFLANFLKF